MCLRFLPLQGVAAEGAAAVPQDSEVLGSFCRGSTCATVSHDCGVGGDIASDGAVAAGANAAADDATGVGGREGPVVAADTGLSAGHAAQCGGGGGGGGGGQGEGGTADLVLQVVVSDAAVIERLAPGNEASRDERLAALRALLHTARRGDERAVAAALALVDSQVAAVAFDALAEVAARGDESAISAAVNGMRTNPDWMSRRAALVALPSLVEQLNAEALNALAVSMADEDWRVRLAAVDVSAQLATARRAPRDAVVAALEQCKKDRHRRVGVAALHALHRVSAA